MKAWPCSNSYRFLGVGLRRRLHELGESLAGGRIVAGGEVVGGGEGLAQR